MARCSHSGHKLKFQIAFPKRGFSGRNRDDQHFLNVAGMTGPTSPEGCIADG
jgi:hypothetical protein